MDGNQPPGGGPASRPGYPLITPHLVFAAAALGGLTLTVVAGLAPETLAPPFKLIAFSVLQNPETAFRVAVAAVAIHVVEAVGTAIVSYRRGYDLPAASWWVLLAFLVGYVGIYAMNEVHSGNAPKLLQQRFYYRVV
jgi:Domain of unknown function (DUF4499)